MKSKIFKSTVLALVISSPMSVLAADVKPEETTVNPIEAIAQIPATGFRAATGVIALPLMFLGEVGNISGQAGEVLWQHASGSNNESIQTTDSNNPIQNKERYL